MRTRSLLGVATLLFHIVSAVSPLRAEEGTTPPEIAGAISSATTARNLLASLPPSVARLSQPLPDNLPAAMSDEVDYQAWKVNQEKVPTVYDLLRSLSRRFDFRYYLSEPPNGSAFLEVVSLQNSKEYFCDETRLDRVLPTLTLAGKKLEERSNVEIDRSTRPTVRISGHRLAVLEITRGVKEHSQPDGVVSTPEELARLFGVYETGKAAPDGAGAAPGTRNAPARPQETGEPAPGFGGRPRFSDGLSQEAVPDTKAAPPGSTRLIGKMIVCTFQLKHASVESQSLNVVNDTSKLPTAVKIPGVANALVAVAAKTFGSGSPKLVSSDGDGTFETFSLARALETTYNNRLDSYKPFAPAPVAPDALKKARDSMLETGNLGEEDKEERRRLNTLLNDDAVNATPTVEKLLPEGVIRIRPGDLAPTPPTEYRTNTAGTGNIVMETARVNGSLPLPVDRGAPTLHNSIIAERATNRIIICDLAERMPIYERIIAHLDVPPKLVEISATILDVDANSALEWGVDWAGLGKEEITEATGTALSTFDGGLRLGGELATNGLRGLTGPGGILTADKVFHPVGLNVSTLITGTSGKLAARLQALETNGKAQVLSRPILLTVANTDALFYDNNSLVLPVPGEFNADLFKLNAPLALRIRPVVMENGEEPVILLDVEIKDDALTSTPNDGTTAARNKAVALLAESSIQTRAVLRLGQSLLLGGRYRHVEQKQEGAVPLLSRIPLVGLAFKDRQNASIKLQRMFLITPRLITPSLDHPLGPPSPSAISRRPPLPDSPRK